MASATRKQTVRKRDRKSSAKSGTRHAATKTVVTPVTKAAHDEATTGENRLMKSRAAGAGKEPAAAESPSETRVPPALPVPIASFTF